ncbi:hypothetical protein QTH97_31980 [Variovorax sp. J22R24]|uniref:hypothetical protein n=1 Tax=Variovorax gracilis TaxID=3053502 RepID=UPI002578483F|nr:hypothetical protein [Variovorax sp. J22R24]MDM0109581.1 hypothetical protein [Variovorax sp. J22R24]
MSLSLFAAESLVRDFLNGRTLPTALHAAVVQAVEARLVGGLIPVLEEPLCKTMDDAATSPPPWSVESVLKAARERCIQLRRASEAMSAQYAT